MAIFYEDMTRENESEGGQERLQRGNEAAAPFIEKKHSPLFVCILKVATTTK